ncbi:MAG TPA: monovalent cation:proton antiporter-2 (CPA2) family protein, partial [Stellaceae bacterium]|nr:monovalent cation:proton antiporter-2 (CPA2) family protein [Stellaceae bacterium]
FLYTLVILLAAAVVAVPVAKRFGFGSVLGYLGAGLIIGPAGLRLVTDVESIAQVSELGVVMLLFLIGLELRPARLWVMRRSVLGLGAAQVAVTAAVLALAGHVFGLAWATAVVVGFGLALSSTAIVLPMLAERELLATRAGRDAFSVLLFQDLAVIPAVALLPLFDGGISDVTAMAPGQVWLAVGKGIAAVLVVLIGGRFLIRPIFRAVEGAKAPEIFTATALVIVMGTAALVSLVGLSMSLGAFMAGVLLSDSEYRHELQADIEPFEGLLLGVFFISVGMGADLALLVERPLAILAGVALLLAIKMAIAFALARISGQKMGDATRFAVALAQAGEFGFVLFGAAVTVHVMTAEQSEAAMLVVTLSMVASPLLFALEERWLAPRLERRRQEREFDAIDGAPTPVIIAGFGRMGQIVGRILRLRRVPYTALDNHVEQIDLVRRFGNKAYYGDPTRLDVLRAAGAAEAKVIVVAIEPVADSLKVVEHVKRHFPNLAIVARARNRRHAHLLMDQGVTHIVRETFYSSLRLTEQVLEELGIESADAKRTIAVFEDHDERTLVDQHGFYDDEKQMIQTSKQAAVELRRLLEADRGEE